MELSNTVLYTSQVEEVGPVPLLTFVVHSTCNEIIVDVAEVVNNGKIIVDHSCGHDAPILDLSHLWESISREVE